MILVDGGDFSPRATEPDKIKAEVIREAMDMMGYDVLAVGERELDYGYDFYKSLIEGTEMQVLAANVTHGPEGEPVGDDYVIMDAGGVKVGFVNIFVNHVPPSRKDMFEEHGYEVQDPVETLKRNLPKAKEKSDYLILLAHAPWGALNEILKEVSGIDFVIAAHEGGTDRGPRDLHGTKLMRPGNRGQYLGKLEIVIDPQGVVKSFNAVAEKVKTSLPEDPEVAAMIKEATERYNDMRRNQTVKRNQEKAEKLQGDKYLGGEVCSRCHMGIHELWVENLHSVAFETLIEKGMERSSDCVGCHTTGHGEPTGYLPPATARSDGAETVVAGAAGGMPDLVGVQCEACHGMGTYHDRTGGDFLEVTKAECVKCHDAEHSPDFDYEDYLPHISCIQFMEAGK